MDALAAVVSLLRPQTILSKTVQGAGRWAVRYPSAGPAGFAVVIKGPCWLAVDGAPLTMLGTGDFVLFPATPGFLLASDPEAEPMPASPTVEGQHVEQVIHGDPTLEPTVSLLGGYFMIDPLNAALLIEMLPRMLHIRADDPAIDSVAPIVGLIRRETGQQRPGQELMLMRLAEVLLIEALRSAPADLLTPGLLAGLRDPQLAAALHGIHTQTAHPWTLATLAREASMSRSSFADRFARVVGAPPLTYVAQWRMAVARSLLAREQLSVAETALAVGYESASGFSTAFRRATGLPPTGFAGAQPVTG